MFHEFNLGGSSNMVYHYNLPHRVSRVEPVHDGSTVRSLTQAPTLRSGGWDERNREERRQVKDDGDALGLAILHALAPKKNGSRPAVSVITLAAQLDQPSLAVHAQLTDLTQAGLVQPGIGRTRDDYRITLAGNHLLG
jgi:hypothetical protein